MNSVEALDLALSLLDRERAELAARRYGLLNDQTRQAARLVDLSMARETLKALRELIAERRVFEMASLEAALDDYGREPFAGKTVDAWLP
jgi:hypothetical protein